MLIIPIFPLDPKLPWGTLNELQASTNHYVHHAQHLLLSPNPCSLLNVSNGPPNLSPLDTRII